MRRLIPFCVLCYLLNYIDRVNVSVAKLKMVGDVPGFTEAVYSTGVAIFFVGYFLFELPSNLIQEKVGPRRWIGRIMISWGLLSMAFMFIRGPWSFYLLRFLLGFAEAGFFPGVILYLSYWIPQAYRARASALFLTSTAIAGVIGNPLGGLLLYTFEKYPFLLKSWQWLFLLEGLPSVLLGLFTLWFLTDTPDKAAWLSPDERTRLSQIMAEERAAHPASHKAGLPDALRSHHTWILCLLYGLIVFGFYAVNFFTPTILKGALLSAGTLTDLTPPHITFATIGLISAIPFGAAAVGMVLIARSSDRHHERKRHLAFACLLIALGLSLAGLAPRLASGNLATLLTLAGLSLGAVGAFGTFGPFWALPPQLMTGTAAAAAFAIINSVGNLIGGFLGPQSFTLLSTSNALLLAGALGGLAMLLTLLAPLPAPARSASPDD